MNSLVDISGKQISMACAHIPICEIFQTPFVCLKKFWNFLKIPGRIEKHELWNDTWEGPLSGCSLAKTAKLCATLLWRVTLWRFDRYLYIFSFFLNSSPLFSPIFIFEILFIILFLSFYLETPLCFFIVKNKKPFWIPLPSLSLYDYHRI